VNLQTTNTIFLVRPYRFFFNQETAGSNVFQQNILSKSDISKVAIHEFDLFKDALISKGITVHVFNDTENPPKPDAVFPNNWISIDGKGKTILYPMCTKNRRAERRTDIIDALKEKYNITEVVDLSFHENERSFLEGTGSMVFDHEHKIAYACLSARTDKKLFLKTASDIGYAPICFNAYDANGIAIYHTNVIMSIGAGFSVICLDSISDKKEKALVEHSLKETEHEIINITFDQVNKFAGNMLALHNEKGEVFIIMSQNAHDSLNANQKKRLSKYGELLPLNINTIETIGGGSVRCMIAEIFAEKKP